MMNNEKKSKKAEVKGCSKASKNDGNGVVICGNGTGKKRSCATSGEEAAVLPARGRRRRKDDCEPPQQQQPKQQRVPDPPTALIRLLQTNKKVLSYFTTLQKYLHQDVQKWKDRALDYKARMEELERQQQQRVNNVSANTDQQQQNQEISYKSFTNVSPSNKQSEEFQRQQQLPSTAPRVPITDEMILLELSGEDSSAALDDLSEVTMDNHYIGKFGAAKNTATHFDDDNSNIILGGGDRDIQKNPENILGKKNASSLSIERKGVSQQQLLLQKPAPAADSHKTVTDEMILVELDGTDESSTSSHENNTQQEGIKTSTKPHGRNDHVLLCHDEEEKCQNLQIYYLKLAHDFLAKLGISLITCEESDILETNNKKEHVARPFEIKDNAPRASTYSSSSTSDSDDNFSLGEELRKVAKGDVVVNDIQSSDDGNGSTHGSSFLLYGMSNKKQFRQEDKGARCLTDNDDNPIPLPEYEKNKKNNNDEGNNSSLNGNILKKSTNVKRRSDYDIAKTLMQVMRLLARKISPNWLPFMGKNHTPCYLYTQCSDGDENSPIMQHPAVQGIHYICKALSIMDVWATDTSTITLHEITEVQKNSDGDTTDHWEQIIQKGMSQRRMLVRSITDTIAIESKFVWSYLDRHARSQNNYSLRYWPDDEMEETEKSELHDSIVQIDWATNLIRLSNIAERCIHAQILASFYQSHNDIQGLGDVVVEYICSSVPLLHVEDYPEYPPALSLCILEAFLFNRRWQDSQKASNKSVTWFTRYLQGIILYPENRETENKAEDIIFAGNLTYLARVISFAVHATACIWHMRKHSSNSRICDVASVEFAAYERLLMSGESTWLGKTDHKLCHNNLNHLKDKGKNLLNELLEDNVHSLVDINIYSALKLLLTSLAKQDDLLKLSSLMLLKHSELMPKETRNPNIPQLIILACVESFMSAICVHHISTSQDVPSDPNNSSGGVLLNIDDMNGFLSHMVSDLLDCIESIEIKDLTVDAWNLATSAVLCALTVRDGDQLYRIAERLTQLVLQNTKKEKIQKLVHIGQRLLQLRPQSSNTFTHFDLIKALVDSAQYPVIRVINLQRRPDRWTKMVVQASRHQLLLVKAVSSPTLLGHSTSCSDSKPLCSCIYSLTPSVWGQHAFDGIGSSTFFEKKMAACLGGHAHLGKLVKSHWRPYMLQPLDRNAKKEQVLVRMDPTERACAVSHTLSWIGVQRSLTSCMIPDHNLSGQGENYISSKEILKFILYRNLESDLFSATGLQNFCVSVHEVTFLRQFQISGFARGQAICCREKTFFDASGTPVCVILEDDAILVDRFSERLEILLNELPSDFHFCSIGYSQPKKAPLFHFSENLVIPSFLW